MQPDELLLVLFILPRPMSMCRRGKLRELALKRLQDVEGSLACGWAPRVSNNRIKANECLLKGMEGRQVFRAMLDEVLNSSGTQDLRPVNENLIAQLYLVFIYVRARIPEFR
jgi:hypothetical protein